MRIGYVLLFHALSQVLTGLPSFAQNALPDPAFAYSVPAGWDMPFYHNIVWSSAPGSDSQPGFARFLGFGPGGLQASICVPVVPNIQYSSGAFVRRDAVPASMAISVAFYSAPGCADASFIETQRSDLVYPETDTWTVVSGPTLVSPASAVAARFAIMPIIPGVGPVQVDFDNVFLTARADGNEIPTLGFHGLVILGLCLAGLGTLLLRRAAG
jgi:hypothetical protein